MESKIIIETERLFLREFNLQDAERLFVLNHDPDVLKYTGDIPFQNVIQAQKFIETYQKIYISGMGRWAVEKKATGDFIGWCGLKKHSCGMIDLGFRFLKKHWNQGYATESAKACIEFAFNTLELSTIVGRVAQKNTASIRVLEKLGMKFWKQDECNGIPNALYYELHHSNYS